MSGVPGRADAPPGDHGGDRPVSCLRWCDRLRAQGVADVASIIECVEVPVIGLLQVGSDGIFITPTLRHALVIARAGASIVAVDGTRRQRPNGRTMRETIGAFRQETDALLKADVGSVDDGIAAIEAGADCLSTTLCGYTRKRANTVGSDLDVLSVLVDVAPVPVFAEGRIHAPEQARACVDAGAHAVVVGTAITHPSTITSWFRDAVR